MLPLALLVGTATLVAVPSTAAGSGPEYASWTIDAASGHVDHSVGADSSPEAAPLKEQVEGIISRLGTVALEKDVQRWPCRPYRPARTRVRARGPAPRGPAPRGRAGLESPGRRCLNGGVSHAVKVTAYYPRKDRFQGGYLDRHGVPLHTLQSYLRGESPYVSVAMDYRTFSYGTRLRIPELERRFGRFIDFRVVDTGGAFAHTGSGRMDICVDTRLEALEEEVNRRLSFQTCE